MREPSLADALGSEWPQWCCPYCSAPLAASGHGLLCRTEERWFATQSGIHRLLPADRRQELRGFVEFYQRVRRDEGWRAEPGLPEVPPSHPHAAIWARRAEHFRRGLALTERHLGAGPWRVLEVGAGCAWASARLVRAGHRVAAVDVNLDVEDGLAAAGRLLDGRPLPRAEAEMDALPLPAREFDLVLAAGVLHYSAGLTRVLIELRRVTRPGGLLLGLDSPVYRRKQDGETMLAARARAHLRRYGVTPPREGQSSYLVLDALGEDFARAGYVLDVYGWPSRSRERARDLIEILRHGRRTARFPVLVGRRER